MLSLYNELFHKLYMIIFGYQDRLF